MLEEKKRYKAVGYAMFAVAAGLALARIAAYFLWDAFSGMSDVAAETAYDTIFTLFTQLGVCLLVPFLIYKFVQKRDMREILHDANCKKLRWWIPVLSVPLGIGCYFVTWFVVAVWITSLGNFGYVYNPGATAYPAQFNPALFALSLFLTAILPAICEEFAMRGNLLKTLRHTFSGMVVVIMAAVAFGLFHQNIVQVVYTALFGGLAAFIVIKTGSIYPAVVMHFVNNALSLYIGYDSHYGWGVADLIDSLEGGIFLLFLLGAGVVAGCTALIVRQSKRDKSQIAVLTLYKPSIRESAWYIGAIVIAALSTVFTFAFGLK